MNRRLANGALVRGRAVAARWRRLVRAANIADCEDRVMLSDLSYRRLRFEGRPSSAGAGSAARPLAARGASALAVVEPAAEAPLSESERRLADVILSTAGLEPTAYRSAPLRRRMGAVLRVLRLPTAEAAAREIAAKPELAQRAINALLNGHTEPFRDAELFDELRGSVVPALTTGGKGLRVWSVGCSAGLELLSVALLLEERGVLADSRLLGTDCRAAAIAAADTSGLAQMAAALGDRYSDLAPRLASAEFAAAVARIEWRVANALEDKPAADGDCRSWDLILCRNVSIYLHAGAAAGLWTRLTHSLAPGGVLVTGKAERPPAFLPLERLAKSLYQRTGSCG